MDNIPEIEEEDAQGGNWARFKIVAGKMTGQYSGKLRLGTAQRLCLTHADALEWTGPSDNPIYDNVAGGIYLEHNDTISDLHIYATQNDFFLSMLRVGDRVRLECQHASFMATVVGPVDDINLNGNLGPIIHVHDGDIGGITVELYKPWKITGWTPKPTYQLPDMSDVPAGAIRFFLAKDGKTIIVYFQEAKEWAFITSTDDTSDSRTFEKYYQDYLPLKPARLEEVDDDDDED